MKRQLSYFIRNYEVPNVRKLMCVIAIFLLILYIDSAFLQYINSGNIVEHL